MSIPFFPVAPTHTKLPGMHRLSKAVVYLSMCWVLNECVALVASLLAISVIPALPLTAVLITVISIFMVIAGLLLFVPVINLPSEQLIWQLNLFCHRTVHSHTYATLCFCLEVNRWIVCVEGTREEGGNECDWRDPYSGEKLPSSWAVGITDTLPAAASLVWLFELITLPWGGCTNTHAIYLKKNVSQTNPYLSQMFVSGWAYRLDAQHDGSRTCAGWLACVCEACWVVVGGYLGLL